MENTHKAWKDGTTGSIPPTPISPPIVEARSGEDDTTGFPHDEIRGGSQGMKHQGDQHPLALSLD